MAEELKPCDCGADETTASIFISKLWDGRKQSIWAIYCDRCGEVEPVKIEPYFNEKEAIEYIHKAWNTRASNERLAPTESIGEALSKGLKARLTHTEK